MADRSKGEKRKRRGGSRALMTPPDETSNKRCNYETKASSAFVYHINEATLKRHDQVAEHARKTPAKKDAVEQKRQGQSRSEYNYQDALRHPKIIDRYLINTKLGQGANGVVYSAWDKQKLSSVAIKFIRDDNVKFVNNQHGGMPLEAYLQGKLCDSSVVRIYRCFKAYNFVAIVMEKPLGYIPLDRFIQQRGGKLEEGLAKIIYRNIAHAMMYCLDQGVFQQDISINNVLVNPSTLHCKLIDFGCAEHVNKDGHLRIWANSEAIPPEYDTIRLWVKNMRSEGHSKEKIESVRRKYGALQADKVVGWACGVVLYHMVTGHLVRDRSRKICIDPSKTSRGFQNVIMRLLDVNLSGRPTLEQALRLPYFNNM